MENTVGKRENAGNYQSCLLYQREIVILATFIICHLQNAFKLVLSKILSLVNG